LLIKVLPWDRSNLLKERHFLSPKKKYVLNLLKETCKIDCNTTKVPIEQNHRIRSDEENSTMNKD